MTTEAEKQEDEHNYSEEKLSYAGVGMVSLSFSEHECFDNDFQLSKNTASSATRQETDSASSSGNSLELQKVDSQEKQTPKYNNDNNTDSTFGGTRSQDEFPKLTWSNEYGLACLSCRCRFLSIGVFAAVFCVALTFESFCSNGINPTNYQSLETRYSFSSTASGVISTMFDIAYCVLAVPIVYFGSRYLTKPKWLAFGLTLVSLGCFTMALPQFISGQYVVSASGDFTLCDSNRSQLYCQATSTSGAEAATEDSSIMYPIILGAGNFLLGAGTVAQNSLAVHYFEENSGNGGFYYGLLQAFRGIGSILGAGSNAIFLRIPVDFKSLDVDHSHTLWVGAWWLGLLIGAIAVSLFVPFIAAFPAKFNNEYTRSQQTENHGKQGTEPENGAVREGEENHRSLKRQLVAIFSNAAWIVYNFASVPEAIIYSGVVTFGAKYFQQNLAMTPSVAAMIFACVILFGIFGTVTGAVVSKKLHSFHTFIKVLMFVSVMELFLSSTILIHCPQQSLHFSPSQSRQGSPADDCAAVSSCQCSPTLFEPVCDPDSKVSYFSPCYAGCVSSDLTHCSCLQSQMMTSSHPNPLQNTTAAVENGLCLEPCWKKVFAVIGMSMFCFMMLAKVPIGMAGSLKLLASTDLASLALAITNILLRVMGMCTGPLLFGALLDNNCDVWELTCDGDEGGESKGSCLIYSVNNLSFQLFLVIMSCAACPLLIYTLTVLVYNRTNPSSSFTLPVATQKEELRQEQKL